MRLEVHPPLGRLALGDVPPPVTAAMGRLVEEWPDVIGNREVVLQLRNSLAMESAVYLDSERPAATIVLDWAQFERLPLVLRATDRRQSLEEQKDRLMRAFAREQRVYWDRRLLTLGTRVVTDEDRRYDGRLEGEPEVATVPYRDEEIHSASRYALYLLGHEMAHLLAEADPEMTPANYAQFEEHYPRLIRPSAGLAEELLCDRASLHFLSQQQVHASIEELNFEFSLIMALERLQNEVRAAAPRLRSGLHLIGDRKNRIEFSGRLEDQVIEEWRCRMFQIDRVLGELLDGAECGGEAREAADRERSLLFAWAEESLREDYMGWRFH